MHLVGCESLVKKTREVGTTNARCLVCVYHKGLLIQ